MSRKSLEDSIREASGPAQLARNSDTGPWVYAGVPPEVTNWRSEQAAWRETCALFQQSHHMTDLYIEGPDAIRLLSDLGVNSFTGFSVNKAKQFVACNADGYVIGDAVLFFLDSERVSLVGRPSAMNWVEYSARSGGYDVITERDERTAENPTGGRKMYRFQVQGPHALDVLGSATKAALPEISFFNMGEITIAGRKVGALHHGMSGTPGMELYGPWHDHDAVYGALVEAGADYGLVRVGSRAYRTNTLESGWISSPLPAVFSRDDMRPYREWLPADGYEGSSSLGGSYHSDDISDYYLTPWDLGYGGFVKFDHDFVGRESLERMATAPPRRKVTLAWSSEDVLRTIGTLFDAGTPARFIDMPLAHYSTWHYDRVSVDSELVGVSTFTGYSFNERSILSLAIVDNDVAIGNEVTITWGQDKRDPLLPTSETHHQVEIRAIVSPCPYSSVARTQYAEGWRTQSVA